MVIKSVPIATRAGEALLHWTKVSLVDDVATMPAGRDVTGLTTREIWLYCSQNAFRHCSRPGSRRRPQEAEGERSSYDANCARNASETQA